MTTTPPPPSSPSSPPPPSPPPALPSSVRERLEQLWAQVPGIDCSGACHVTCTVIDASAAERAVLTERGVDLPLLPRGSRQAVLAAAVTQIAAGHRCPALSPLGTCTVHDVRPLLCRLYGVTEGLGCGFGCRPHRLLSATEGWALLLAAEELLRGQDR